jgi:hypothetical protein
MNCSNKWPYVDVPRVGWAASRPATLIGRQFQKPTERRHVADERLLEDFFFEIGLGIGLEEPAAKPFWPTDHGRERPKSQDTAKIEVPTQLPDRQRKQRVGPGPAAEEIRRRAPELPRTGTGHDERDPTAERIQQELNLVEQGRQFLNFIDDDDAAERKPPTAVLFCPFDAAQRENNSAPARSAWNTRRSGPR